jgi:hypothetical protein
LYETVQKLSFLWFLLMQASCFGMGLLGAASTLVVLIMPERRRTVRLLVLPALWLLPPVAAAVFYQGEMKSADWLGHVSLIMLVAYVAAAVWSIVTLPGSRALATICALINAPFAVLSSLVVGMASSGTWL